MTDTSTCGHIEFHVLWCRDCVSLILHQWCPRWHHSLIRLPMRFRLRSFRIRLHRVKKTQNTESKGKNQWTDTEEKIQIELFGENEDKLRYRSFNFPEWQSIARQLQERWRRENVESEKSAQQCKNKMANLIKKYKTVKDKLKTTGYGKGGDDEDEDKETEKWSWAHTKKFSRYG